MLEALQDLAPFEAIHTSDYLFPTIETVHVVGLVFVIGSIAMVDLRLLGLADRGQGVTAVTRRVLPWTWSAFGLALVTGLALFASNAVQYAHNLPFLIKLCLLGLAGLNMLGFHLITHRSIASWDQLSSPPTAVKLAGALSLTLWIAIVFAGRWIGFVL